MESVDHKPQPWPRRSSGAHQAGPGHDNDPWAPLVVDTPSMPITARPPATGPYRPDTLCDGWSTPHFTVRLASVRGYSHRYTGTPRQDDVVVAVHPATQTVIFAVADGVSAAHRSHLGAATACRAATLAVLDALDKDPDRIDWAGILDTVVSRLTRDARHVLDLDHPDLAEVAAVLATTLVVGTVRPHPGGPVATLVQVGDSSAWLLRRGHYESLLSHKMAGGGPVFSSAVSALPQLPDRIHPVPVALPPDGVLLVGTDGFGDPLGDGSGLVGQLFADHLRTPPPPLRLAHVLDFSRETFDDDRTIVAVWPYPEGP